MMPTLNAHCHFFGLQEGERNEADSESDECILYAFDAQFHGWPHWLYLYPFSLLTLVDATEVCGETDPWWNARLGSFRLFQWISSTIYGRWSNVISFPLTFYFSCALNRDFQEILCVLTSSFSNHDFVSLIKISISHLQFLQISIFH